jgi:glutaredoxin
MVSYFFKEANFMTRQILFFIAVVFVFYGTAHADFYTWEDEQGVSHITDYPPPAKSGKKFQTYRSDTDILTATSAEGHDKPKDAGKEADIILYTKNSCDDCDKAREFLKAKKVPFTEYNIDAGKEAARKRKEADDSTDSPFAIIYRNQVYGFSEAVYNRAMRLKP